MVGWVRFSKPNGALKAVCPKTQELFPSNELCFWFPLKKRSRRNNLQALNSSIPVYKNSLRHLFLPWCSHALVLPPPKRDMSLCLSSHNGCPGALGRVSVLEVVPAVPRQVLRPDQHPCIPDSRQGCSWPCLIGWSLLCCSSRSPVDRGHAVLGLPTAGHTVACHFLGYATRTLDLVAFHQSHVFSWNSDFRGLWLANVSCLWWGWDPGEGLQCPAKWTSSFCLNLTLIFGTTGDLFLEPHFSETHLHATLPGFLVQIFCHLLLRQSVVSVLDEVL